MKATRRCGALAHFLSIVLMLFGTGALRVYSEPLTWDGEVVIDSVRTLPGGTQLTITPGTHIRFVGMGRLVSTWHCNIRAQGATFSAEEPLVGQSRLDFSNTDTEFAGCRFCGLRTEKKRFHNAGICATYGRHVWTDCMLTDCSALEFIVTANVELAGCVFLGCQDGVVFRDLRSGLIESCEFRRGHGTGVLLNQTEDVTVRSCRVFGKTTGIQIYRRAIGNRIIGNSVFDCYRGLCFWGGPSKNVLVCNLVEKSEVGLFVRGSGLENGITNSVFAYCGTALLCLEEHRQSPLAVRNSIFFQCKNKVRAGGEDIVSESNLFWQCPITNEGSIRQSDTREVDPAFLDPEHSDYRLAPNSPLLNLPPGTPCPGLFP